MWVFKNYSSPALARLLTCLEHHSDTSSLGVWSLVRVYTRMNQLMHNKLEQQTDVFFCLSPNQYIFLNHCWFSTSPNETSFSILHKTVYRINAISIKIPMVYFTELEQIFQKSMWNHKDPKEPQQSWEKKNKVGEIATLPDIRLHYKVVFNSMELA